MPQQHRGKRKPQTIRFPGPLDAEIKRRMPAEGWKDFGDYVVALLCREHGIDVPSYLTLPSVSTTASGIPGIADLVAAQPRSDVAAQLDATERRAQTIRFPEPLHAEIKRRVRTEGWKNFDAYVVAFLCRKHGIEIPSYVVVPSTAAQRAPIPGLELVPAGTKTGVAA
ncbi:hypothetical protein [Microbispora bryophytorum]|uniref:hypothetical protein n=1 Tax=Microbispora bryophytorum TaxID=1460882 RepID=UPI0033D28E35